VWGAASLPRPERSSFGAEDVVANIKSQIKRNLTNEKRRVRNKGVRSEMKTRTKNAVAAVGTEDEETALRLAIKRIDKSASLGVIHKNQAANRKSRLMRRVNALRATD
jgi:small subunit ribosomal protein S20